MFLQKRYIIFLQPDTIQVHKVTLGPKPKDELLATIAWTKETLSSVLAGIKKRIGADVRVLLSEDFVYTTYVILPLQSHPQRKDVQQKAQEQIPENLDETTWNFKQMLISAASADHEGTTIIQVSAVIGSLYKALQESLARGGLKISAIASEAATVARIIASNKEPVLAIAASSQPLLIVLQKGLIVTTKRLPTEKDLTTIPDFLLSVKTQHLIDIQTLVFLGSSPSFDPQTLASDTMHIAHAATSPVVGLAKQHITKDKDELSFSFTKLPNERQATKETTDEQTDQNDKTHGMSFRKLFLVLFLVLFNIGVIVGGIVFVNSQSETPTATKKPQTLLLSPTPLAPKTTPTPTKKIYSLAVLNGSGTPGQATKIADLLKEASISVSETGNADTYTYTATEVHYKATVPVDVKESIDKVLKTVYDTITQDSVMDNKQTTDIVIILGNL